jgi:nicotinamidase-related amidase
VDYVIKGMNPLTEHFSAVEAELPLADDPHTQANRGLIQRLVSSDVVWVAGWARSHCDGSTLRDLFKWGGRSLAEKTVLITDTMSDVTGFEEHGEQVVKDALKWGAQLADVSTLLQG